MKEWVDEIRALLREFTRSSRRELSGSAGEWELYLAREGAGPNPLNARIVGSDAPAIAVSASHLGIFSARLSNGSSVRPGEEIGVLTVLDRETSVTSADAGRIEFCMPDGLAEYGAELARVTPF